MRPLWQARRRAQVALVVLAGATCAGAEPPASGPVQAEALPAAPFDAAHAWSHLERILAFGPRPPASEAAAEVRGYLRTHFAATGAAVHQQVFTAATPEGPATMTNLWAEVPGASERVLIVGAHADSKRLREVPEFLGANDSAAALGVLLALAEALRSGPAPPVTVWLVAFDGEEAFGPWSETDGLYGSRAFVRQLRERGDAARVEAMVNLDMIGDEHLRLVREGQSTPWLTDRIWATAARLGVGRHFAGGTQDITDDHVPFLKAGLPAADLIDFSYGPRSMDNRWWHTRYDTLAHCRPASLGVVGRVVLRLVREWEPGAVPGQTPP